jgi:class 3 adenylate cyclase/tetratricopeptide (TPR) repeat protein
VMNKSKSSTMDMFPPSPPQKRKGRSPHTAHRMVVLFTDIVGSTKYFRSHGNLAGREMLQNHQEVASKPIIEYGGYLVKTLGDSVMAYFIDPREAIKAAIRIQQGFQSYNEARSTEKQIHIRMGVHLGEAIVEEKDIFGDVVNMAAKLVQVADIDQILISQELYDAVKDLSHGLFQLVDVSDKTKIPKGLSIYQILWQTAMAFALTTNTILYLRPLLNPDKAAFQELWESVLASKGSLWGGKVDKERILSNQSVVLIIKDAALCISIANDVLTFLQKKLGNEYETLPPPIQIIIDSGFYLSDETLTIDALEVDWHDIAPGRIYISHAAYRLIEADSSFSTIPPFNPEQPRKFYSVILDSEHHTNESRLFPYQNALIRGDHPPCFYCGDRRHLPVHCPSKQLMELTDAVRRLGYLSLDNISRLFYHYLSGVGVEHQTGSEASYKKSSSNLLAYRGFYELKAVFQVRLFRILWNSTVENWEEIQDMSIQEDRGGAVWLAQDCMRVADLAKAEGLLRTCIKEDPKDYKGYCAMGFLSVEKGDFHEARIHFETALRHAKTSPQRTFLLFLLFRLHYLFNDLGEAEKKVRQILRISPQCQEAIYQDAVLRFRNGSEEEALMRLTRLMEGNGEYYVKALIDPELAPFSESINPILERLFAQSKNEAHEITSRAREGLEQIKGEIGENSEEMERAASVFSKIDELLETDSYMGYRDVIHHARVAVSIVNECLEGRRKKVQQLLYESTHRCREYLKISANYPYRYLVNPLHTQLSDIDIRIEKARSMLRTSNAPEVLRTAFSTAEIIAADLDEIGPRLRRLVMMKKVGRFFSGFFKKSLIFQLLNFLISMIVFPVIVHYLNLFAPEPGLLRDIWPYQKFLLVMGGIFGLFLASLTATRGKEAM